jgi:hypothetical protein
MMNGSNLALEPGDVAPPTYGVTLDQTFFSLDAQAGRPAALIFPALRCISGPRVSVKSLSPAPR